MDPETQRIHKTGPSKWYFDRLKPEFKVWVEQGLISEEARVKIIDKYIQAYRKIEQIDQDLRNPPDRDQQILVEIAIDRQGNGYPVKLFFRGKEYR